jgi:oligosaccharide repeat unit polymerase
MLTIIFTIWGYLTLLISKRLFYSYFSPFGIFGLLWALLFALYYLKIIPYFDLSLQAKLILYGSYFSFLIGGLTAGIAFQIKRRNNKPRKTTTFSFLSKNNQLFFKKAILIVGTLAFVSSIIYLLKVIEFVDWQIVLQKPWLMKYAPRSDLFEINKIWGYLSSFNYIVAIMGGFYCAAFSFRYWPVYLAIAGGLVNSMASLGRAFMIEIVIFYLVAYFLTKLWKEKKLKLKITLRKTVIGGIILVLFFSALVSVVNIRRGVNFDARYTSEYYTGSTIPDPIFQYYRYFSANLPAFDAFITNFDENEKMGYGKITFFPITKQFYKLGIIKELPKVKNYENVRTPIPINTFTYLRPIYQDFRFLGTIILPYLIGLISSFLFLNFLFKPNFIKLIILSYIYLYIISTYIASSLSSMMIWVSLLVFLFIMLIKKHFFSDKNPFKKYVTKG